MKDYSDSEKEKWIFFKTTSPLPQEARIRVTITGMKYTRSLLNERKFHFPFLNIHLILIDFFFL
jgi:hypothetical protein